MKDHTNAAQKLCTMEERFSAEPLLVASACVTADRMPKMTVFDVGGRCCRKLMAVFGEVMDFN